MTASEINIRYSSEKLGEFGFKPVGVLALGDTTFLIQTNKDGLYSLEPVDPNSQRDYYKKQTERLNQKNYYNVPGVDAVQVTYAQINTKSQIKANWNETTGGADRPEIEIPVIDPILFDERTIELSEDLLKDLFLPNQRNKQATFFTMETADQEIVGIAIKGTNPKLLLLPPALDGSRMSTIAGLNNFFEAVYLRLLERATQIQKQVDSGIFEASLPTKARIIFSAEATKKTLASMHKKIYQIQGLLISLRSDERLGTQDPNIVAFAPFLRNEVKQTGISALLNKSQKPSNLVVDGNIWTALNEVAGAGLISTGPRTARPINVRPVTVVNSARPVVAPRPAPEAARPLSEKEKAVNLAKDLDSSLCSTLTYFKDYTLDTIGLKQIAELGARLELLTKAAEKYTSERRRGKPPTNPTPTRISAPSQSINLAGAKDGLVFSFITGSQTVLDYKDKIDKGLSFIQSTIVPVMTATTSRQERMLTSVKTSRLIQRLPGVREKLIPELEAISKTVRVADLSTAEVSFALLSTQICYTLWARYQEIKKNGSEIEIDNWANYCYTVCDRLRSFSKELIAK